MVWLRILGWISLGVLLGALAGALAREWTTHPATLGRAPSSWSPGPLWAKTVKR
jgi:hypothetical protein